MFGTAWIHLLNNEPTLVQGMEGTAIVLETISQFFVHSVNIQEYLITKVHNIEIYQRNGGCDDWPSNSTRRSITNFTNLSNIYLLEGTPFDFHLTLPLLKGSTESVSFFLTSGLQISDFNPHQLHKEDIHCYKMIQFDGQPYYCSQKITQNGYYNVHFLLPSISLVSNYNLSLTFSNSTILLSEEDYKCDIAEGNDCDLSFTFSGSVNCLVANFLKSNNTDPVLTLRVSTTEFSLAPVLGITVGIFVVVTLLSVVLTLFCVCVICC